MAAVGQVHPVGRLGVWEPGGDPTYHTRAWCQGWWVEGCEVSCAQTSPMAPRLLGHSTICALFILQHWGRSVGATLQCSVQHYSAVCNTTQCSVQHYSVVCNTTLQCAVCNTTVQCATLHCSVQCATLQCSVQHYTVLCATLTLY